MSEAEKKKQLHLSTDRVDFGIVGPGDRSVRRVGLVNLPPQRMSIRVVRKPPWITPRLCRQAGRTPALELAIDAAELPGSGRHAADMKLQIGERHFTIGLSVMAAGLKRREPSGATPEPTGSSRRRHEENVGNPSQAGSSIVPAAVTGVILVMVFASVYQLSATLFVQMEGGAASAGIVTGVLLLGYIVFALWGAHPPQNTLINPNSTVAEHRRLLDALAGVCQRADMPVPRVVVRPDDRPNLYSLGLTRQHCCLYVNRGVMKTLGNDEELAAVVAHEIGHWRNGDNFYFLFLRPTLKVVYAVLAGAKMLFFHTTKMRRGGMAMSPFGAMMMMQGASKMGIYGLVVLMVAAMVMLFVVMTAALYAGVAVLAIGGTMALGLAYSQYLERRADLEAARIVDNPDSVLIALARCVDHYPTEVQYMNAFAAQHLPNPDDYALDDIVRAIKDGARIHTKVTLMDRYLRSHPLVLFRIENVVKTMGSSMK